MSFEVIQAKDVSVLVRIDTDDVTIGCCTAMSLKYQNEIIGKTDVNAGLFRKKRVRMSDFSASVQGLSALSRTTGTNGRVGSFYFLQEAIRRTEQYITFVFTDQGGVVRTVAGNYLIETLDHSGGAEGDFSNFDMELQGTGDLELSDLESPAEPECFEAFSDDWLISSPAGSISGAGTNGRNFAGQTVLEVVRESQPPLEIITVGTPTDRQVNYDGTTLTFWSGNPLGVGERIFVLWQQVV